MVSAAGWSVPLGRRRQQVKDRFTSMEEFAAALTDYLRAAKQERAAPAGPTAITTTPAAIAIISPRKTVPSRVADGP